MARQYSALAIVIACACSAHTVQPRSGGAEMLAYVPAETPYVIAGLEPFHLDSLDAYMRAVGPEIGKFAAKKDEDARVWRALDHELGGDYGQTGWAKLGFTPRPHFAVYGLGYDVVVGRVELADGRALVAAVQRIATAAGLPAEAPHAREGRTYWTWVKDGKTTLVAILDDQLVVAHGPTARVDAELPAILGITRPARSLDRQILASAAEQHHLSLGAVGVLDVGKLLAAYATRDGGAPSQACSAAIHAAAAHIPQVVGTLAIDEKRWDMSFYVDLDAATLKQLRATQVDVPGFAAELAAQRFTVVGGGVDVVKAQQVAASLGAGVHALAETCQWPKMREAGGELESVARPLPAAFASIRGGYLSLHTFSRERVDGVAVLATTQAAALYQLASAFIPDLGLTADGAVHPLTGKFLASVPYKFFGAIGEHAIVIGAGDHGDQLVQDALAVQNAPARGPATPLIAWSYDYARWQEVTRSFGTPKGPPLPEELMHMFGRTEMSLELTERGLAFRTIADRNH